jgi:3-methyladenine DNA glycosylase/8-oxoguanine DNA glycosylase
LQLLFPEPYDFGVSTERFRAFGIDLANLWHEGGLHRVVGGREVRIEAAPGGVDVMPLDDETRPVVEKLLGLEFELPAFYAWAAEQPVLGPLALRLAGFRPPLAPDPFESLVTSITAQQVSLFAAFAIRNRLIERFGVRGDLAYGFPARERIAAAGEDELVALGFSRRKAEYVIGLARSDLDLDELPALVYTRGFVQQVAKFLKLDPTQVTKTYLRRLREWRAESDGETQY